MIAIAIVNGRLSCGASCESLSSATQVKRGDLRAVLALARILLSSRLGVVCQPCCDGSCCEASGRC